MDSLENSRERFEALAQQMEHLPHHPQVVEAQTRRVARQRLTRLLPGLCGLLALGLMVGWLTPAAGQAISCGATLGPGGTFILEADLDCGTVSPALTVRDGAHLDLGGHTISAAGSVDQPIILLDGHGAVVHHGIVEDRIITRCLVPGCDCTDSWSSGRGLCASIDRCTRRG